MPTARTLLLALPLAVACRTPQPPAPAARPAAEPPPAAAPAPAAPAPAAIPRAEADPSRTMIVAWQRGLNGDLDGALEGLRKLDAVGWSIPLDPADWKGLTDRPEYRELAARVAARAPRTAHAPVAFTIPERGLVAEGIAVDPSTGAVLVGSIRQRKIVRVAPDGTVSDLVPTAAGGLLAPLGLKVDAARGLLWAGAMRSEIMPGAADVPKGRAGVFAFDLATGAPRRAVFTEGGEHLLNDLAIAPDGTVYVTDSAAGAVHRLAPGADRLEALVPGGLVYPNGLVLLDGELLVNDAFGMTVVPLDGSAPRPVKGPPDVPLGGIDGLALVSGPPGRSAAAGAAESRELVGIQNGMGTPRIVRFVLEGETVTRAEVLEAGNPGWRVPTTGAVAGDALLYVGNSHVDGVSPAGLAPEAAAAETRIYRLPLR